MKILLYGLNFAPELTGIGRFSGDMAIWLAARGHDVRAITAPPYYPEWKVGAGYTAWAWRRERLSGVRVLRCPLYVPAHASGLRRIFHLASFAATSALPAATSGIAWRPDVVFAVEPTAFVHPAALAASRLGGALSWLHVQDLEFDAAFDLGLVPSALSRPALAAERLLMRGFDVVSTISPRMADRLGGKGVPKDRSVLFPNWVDTTRIDPQGDGIGFRRELGVPEDAVVALYSGNIGEKQGMDQIAAAARAVADTCPADGARVCFVLAGAGAGREVFAKILRDQGLGEDMVRLIPLQPEERLSALLAAADIHLLPQRPEAADLVMPSKLGGMLASGRPVVAAAAEGTQVASVVASCGRVVPPGDGTAMGREVRALAGDPDLRRRLGAAARAEALANWDRDAILTRFEAELRARVAQRRSGRGPTP